MEILWWIGGLRSTKINLFGRPLKCAIPLWWWDQGSTYIPHKTGARPLSSHIGLVPILHLGGSRCYPIHCIHLPLYPNTDLRLLEIFTHQPLTEVDDWSPKVRHRARPEPSASTGPHFRIVINLLAAFCEQLGLRWGGICENFNYFVSIIIGFGTEFIAWRTFEYCCPLVPLLCRQWELLAPNTARSTSFEVCMGLIWVDDVPWALTKASTKSLMFHGPRLSHSCSMGLD